MRAVIGKFLENTANNFNSQILALIKAKGKRKIASPLGVKSNG
jgi:hypothetical protein